MIQPPGGLFTRAGDPAPEYWVDNLANLLKYIDTLHKRYGLKSNVGFLELAEVEQSSAKILGSLVAIATPSVFKRIAAFTLGFMQVSPLKGKIPPEFFNDHLKKVAHIENHLNAIVAFGYSRACLVGATYKCGKRDVVLANKIKVSAHFYADLIFSLTTIPKNGQSAISSVSFHEMALLYESLAYQDNPDACYPRDI